MCTMYSLSTTFYTIHHFTHPKVEGKKTHAGLTGIQYFESEFTEDKN